MDQPIYAKNWNFTREEVEQALREAILQGNYDSLEAGLRLGVSVDLADMAGDSPLMAAAAVGRLDIVELLCRYGAVPDERCIERACEHQNEAVTSLLLEQMAFYQPAAMKAYLHDAVNHHEEELSRRNRSLVKIALRHPDFRDRCAVLRRNGVVEHTNQ